MSTDLVRRDPYGWTDNLPAVGDLAGKVAATEFVPASLRGKPAAVAACILFGAEVGIGPMRSLSSIHVVDGRPAMSAELMRALVLAAGHSIRVVELTTTRCVLLGTRRGDTDGTTIAYSIDDAKRAGVAGRKTWQSYPREMMLARATTVLCRAVFADVIGGMGSLEEAEDGTTDVAPDAGPGTAVRRTARRAGTTTPAPAPRAADVPAAPAPPVDVPPLDDDIIDGEVVDEDTGEVTEAVTAKQLTAIAAAMSAVGWRERDDRLRLASAVAGRPLGSSKELTKDEAATLLDALAFAQATDDPRAAIETMLKAADSE